MKGLLKYWPITNSQKEVLYLGELEEILEFTQSTEFRKVMKTMFTVLGRCLKSSHFQVAERALFLWNNDYVVSMIAQNKETVLPIIFSALESNSRNHWNSAVHGLTCNVRKMFIDMDKALWDKCLSEYEETMAGQQDKEAQRLKSWERLEALAKQNYKE